MLGLILLEQEGLTAMLSRGSQLCRKNLASSVSVVIVFMTLMDPGSVLLFRHDDDWQERSSLPRMAVGSSAGEDWAGHSPTVHMMLRLRISWWASTRKGASWMAVELVEHDGR